MPPAARGRLGWFTLPAVAFAGLLVVAAELGACASANGPKGNERDGGLPTEFIDDDLAPPQQDGDGATNEDLSAMLPDDGGVTFDFSGPKPDLAASALSGTIDPTFGIPFVLLPSGTDMSISGWQEIWSVQPQPDGKVVAIGNFPDTMGIARYTSTGTLDSTFGNGGVVSIKIGAYNTFGSAGTLQNDQKVVIAGRASSSSPVNPAIARVSATGVLDTGFNGTGSSFPTITPTGFAQIYGTAQQADGKIVAVGFDSETTTKLMVLRFTTAGALDTTFNGTGKIISAIGTGNAQADAVVIQADGKIVVAGRAMNGSTGEVALLRYNTDGTPDTGFGTSSGKTLLSFGAGDSSAHGVALQSNGKIVICGDVVSGTRITFLTARFNTSGTLDTSFGTGGSTFTPFSAGNFDSAAALAIQSDDKPVVVGTTYVGGSMAQAAVARLTADGSLDATFNGTGTMLIQKMWRDSDANTVAIQQDGRIVVAGGAFPIAPETQLARRSFLTRIIP